MRKYTEEIRKKFLADNKHRINEDLLNHIELSNLCQWAQENIDSIEIKEEKLLQKSTIAKAHTQK
jgi:hypothetical protein